MGQSSDVPRHRTALSRTTLSRPLQLAFSAGFLAPGKRVLDYGCGKGDDIRALRSLGYECQGWDPAIETHEVLQPAHVVNLGFVLNVIEDPAERKDVLQRAWGLCQEVLVVAVRTTLEVRGQSLSPFGDGYVTTRGTFQKFYSQSELRNWLDEELGENLAAPAGPGVFFGFKDPNARQRYQASQFKTRGPTRKEIKAAVFEHHKDLLTPLTQFVESRGRLPGKGELPESEAIEKAFGSLLRAFSVIRTATGDEIWSLIRDERMVDLVVFLALDRFGERPRLSDLPTELQLDIKALFGSYKRACQISNDALFAAGDTPTIEAACRQSSIGKLTPEALYVHSSALSSLPPILRIYEGCARVLVGEVEGANVIKLNRRKPRISYLAYEDFDGDPHPRLGGSLVVDLRKVDLQYWNYADSENPFILHRKENLVSKDYPLRKKFEKLTRQEEKHGLYRASVPIGTRRDWDRLLKSKGLRQRGHQVVRARQKRVPRNRDSAEP